MTLVITAVAAVVATIVRFWKPALNTKYRFGLLALMYWGAALMWSIDGFAALIEGESFIELSDATAMTDDALLGLCVVALGLAVWGIALLVKRLQSKPTSASAKTI